MQHGLLFRRLPEGGRPTRTICFDGQSIEARDGDSVAAALLAAGITQTRTTAVSGAPRAPYCLMGICFECLVEIDGVQNVQACMVEVAEGMVIRSMQGAPGVSDSPEDCGE